jgi:hypothetical protein
MTSVCEAARWTESGLMAERDVRRAESEMVSAVVVVAVTVGSVAEEE